MKRSLIALAVSAAVIAPAAMAGDVTVYGRAQVELGSISYQDGAGQEDGLGVADNAMGRVGVKASEDLGGGMKALARFEFKADTADNTSSGKTDAAITAREAFVGLKGGFGQVELGALKQGYKYAGGVTYDPFVATYLQARGNGGMTFKPAADELGHGKFHTNALGYGGKFGPVKLRLTYGPSENDGSLTASGKFSNPMFEVFLAIVDSGDKLGATTSYSATKLGGQFRMAGGAHKISAQYEMAENDNAGTTTEPTNLFVGYQGKFGKNMFVAQFGMEDNDAATLNETSYLALGAIHKFSKTTRVFGGYRNTDADADDRESVVSIGMRKDF